VRRAALEKMAIAVLCHPLRALEVALPGAPRSFGFLRWIDVQHYARHLGPIRSLSVGIEEAEIGDQVLLVVSSENVSLRSLIINGRVEGRIAHIRLYSSSALGVISLARRSSATADQMNTFQRE
jgi:hypothetical protein